MDEQLRRAQRAGDDQRVRALRRRAGQPVCGHPPFPALLDDAPSRPVSACAHLLEGEASSYHQRLLGDGHACTLICDTCRADPDPSALQLREVCAACLRALLDGGGWIGVDDSALEIKTRDDGLRLIATTEPELIGPVLALAPLPGTGARVLALTPDRRLICLGGGSARVAASLPDDAPVSDDMVLLTSGDGRQAALAPRHGQHGLVVDLDTGEVLLALDRGDYHVEHCDFPLAFVTRAGRPVLVHATAWNRLDVTDPRSGECLTQREHEPVDDDEPPAHALDYFHCGLAVSPDGRWIAEDGWVWHPFGITTWWSLERWLTENPWESEDGPTQNSTEGRAYVWDEGLCFLDATTLVSWGYGHDDEWLTPAVRLVDVEGGRPERWVFGVPRGALYADVERRHLIAVSSGVSVWDLDTGERLLDAPGQGARTYHPDAHALIDLVEGQLRRTRIVGPANDLTRPAPSAWLGQSVRSAATSAGEARA